MSLTRLKDAFDKRPSKEALALSLMFAFVPAAAANDDTAKDAHDKCMKPVVEQALSRGDTNFQAPYYKAKDALCSSKDFKKVGVYLSKGPDDKYSAGKILHVTGNMLGRDIQTHETIHRKAKGVDTLSFFVNGAPVIFRIDGEKTSEVTLAELKDSARFVADLQRAGLQTLASLDPPSTSETLLAKPADQHRDSH